MSGFAWLSGHEWRSALVGGCLLGDAPRRGSETPAPTGGLRNHQDRDHTAHTENPPHLRTNTAVLSRNARRYGCAHAWVLLEGEGNGARTLPIACCIRW